MQVFLDAQLFSRHQTRFQFDVDVLPKHNHSSLDVVLKLQPDTRQPSSDLLFYRVSISTRSALRAEKYADIKSPTS